MLCARCNSENANGARFCNACGSSLTPSSAPDRAPGSALTPRAEKELDTLLPRGEFRQTAIQTDPASLPTEAAPQAKRDSISTEPRPVYVKHIPTNRPGTVSMPAAAPRAGLWQWGLAIASTALFLYNSGIVMAIVLFWAKNGKVAGLSTPLIVSLALAGAACCGIALGLSGTKTTLTVIAGGVLMRSIAGLLQTGAFSPEWLLVTGL